MLLALQRPVARRSSEIVLCNAAYSDSAHIHQYSSLSPAIQRRPRKCTAKENGILRLKGSGARGFRIKKFESAKGSETRSSRIRNLESANEDDDKNGKDASERSWPDAKESGILRRKWSGSWGFRVRKFDSATEDDKDGKGAIERSWPNASKEHTRLPTTQGIEGDASPGQLQSTARSDSQTVPMTPRDLPSGIPDSRTQLHLPTRARGNDREWESHLVTLEQYQRESNIVYFRGPRLVDDLHYAQDWDLWLELIVFRRRHLGARGPMPMFKDIFRRGLWLPTQGDVADQLWDLLIRASFHDLGILEEILSYALRLKSSTGRSWSRMYYGIVSTTLKKDPKSAYSWHARLRDNFSPSLEDYQKLFEQSFGRRRSEVFRDLYMDHPIIGMYKTVIWHLCEMQMYTEALKWHDLLYEAKDFPAEINDVQPLLSHLIYMGDRLRFENIVGQLAEINVEISKTAENLERRNLAISPEVLNQQLGQVHGVAPRRLSDSFCARLFATRLFSVDTVISGLHMMAAESIGPLSLREIAVRDNCNPGAICHHIDRLKDAGIHLDDSFFCVMIRSLALEGKGAILDSVVNCDLHPDTFADYNLQERLLAQYCWEDDLVQVERTLAVLTTSCPMKKLELRRINLMLRCHVSLGQREKALALLEEMKIMNIPVSARSSRHLRVCWLSRRQVGRRPNKTHELTILIKASQLSMESGNFVPIKAWREILRRLGMTARLREFEDLALWLMDWYSSPAAEAALSKWNVLPMNDQQYAEKVWQANPRKRHPRQVLNTLFTTAALHAIVAWGFQHKVKSYLGQPRPTTLRYQWTWGLHLLRKLKDRGLPIERSEVFRICRHRLDALFGRGVSNRTINRRARADFQALGVYSESFFIHKMEAIWGKLTFRAWLPVRTRKGRTERRPRMVWRLQEK